MRPTTFSREDAAARRVLLERRAEPATSTPVEFLAFIRADNAKWAKLIKDKGIVVEGAK